MAAKRSSKPTKADKKRSKRIPSVKRLEPVRTLDCGKYSVPRTFGAGSLVVICPVARKGNSSAPVLAGVHFVRQPC